ncbi:hypothetical protein PHYPO_G00184700 [Pangasianodon hypophthalmus]|uniref:NADH dehydrogenase [ubiquinone] 1 alpha subcomplex assembly factor 4 n=1 Tax=Pangasianodon hypophthalmus TaxID=310915 RepID=A0A5N5JGV4_PANHP|nr:hypothetical protein PHYPO_G00184700 [Pangasianodon hypophthalmus]
MGARVGRLFRNFNLEARAHREIGKSKTGSGASASVSEIHRKDDPLLNRLRQVYVESKDPQTPVHDDVGECEEVAAGGPSPLSPHWPRECDITDVPKGKLTIVEANS